MLRLLHTADVHLGARHADLGDQAAAQRERQFAAFGATVDLALEEKVDAFVVALDALSGRAIWKTSIASAFRNSTGNGPRSTPTIAGDHVYAFTGDGVLAALSFTDDGIAEIARIAARLNARMENIGARRLHTVMTTLLESVLYELPERGTAPEVIDGATVRARLAGAEPPTR